MDGRAWCMIGDTKSNLWCGGFDCSCTSFGLKTCLQLMSSIFAIEIHESLSLLWLSQPRELKLWSCRPAGGPPKVHLDHDWNFSSNCLCSDIVWDYFAKNFLINPDKNCVWWRPKEWLLWYLTSTLILISMLSEHCDIIGWRGLFQATRSSAKEHIWCH